MVWSIVEGIRFSEQVAVWQGKIICRISSVDNQKNGSKKRIGNQNM